LEDRVQAEGTEDEKREVQSGLPEGLVAVERTVAMATPADEAKPPRSSQRSNLQRITVNLTPRSWQALDHAVKQTGDSQTDTINRALQVYSYLANITENDGTVYVRDAGSDELERLHII
jgi:hypothetical protein